MPKPKTVRRGLFVLAGVIFCGCSPGGGTGGSGGSPGSGGVPGSGGAGVTGGAPGVGGVPGAGGAALTGGAANVGGTPGVGGAGAAPGSGGAGAAPGSGGDGNTGPATVHLDDTRQLIRGFGINNNWAPFANESEGASVVADNLFGDGANGLDLNILRVGMGPTGEPYNGADCYDDIDAAVQRGAQYIIATLWSPPGDMKITREGAAHPDGVNNGGHLDPADYEAWSDTIAAFADKIEQNTTTTLYAMSPQNEADFASCGREEPCNGNYDTTVMTGAQAVAFQKIVAPKLVAKGVKPMSPEASEWIHVWSNDSASGSEPSGLPSSDPLDCGFPGTTNCTPGAPFDDGYEYGYALYSDPEAWAAFDIMGTHQYDTQVGMPWPADVPQGDKEVWQTEMSGVKWWPEQGTLSPTSEPNMGGQAVSPSTHIQNGVAVARWVHSGLVDGSANAWLYWWYRAIDTDDNEGLLTKSGTKAKRYYTFGNFSRYVKPGYHRVGFTGALPAGVLISSYKGDAGEVVIVAINETETAQSVPVTISGGTAPATLTPYVTDGTANWAAGAAVTVTAGAFDAALPAMSVTTYVYAP